MALIRHIFFLGFGHFWFNLWMNLALHFFGHGNPASCLKQMDRKKEQVAIQKNGFEDVANIKKRKKKTMFVNRSERKKENAIMHTNKIFDAVQKLCDTFLPLSYYENHAICDNLYIYGNCDTSDIRDCCDNYDICDTF